METPAHLEHQELYDCLARRDAVGAIRQIQSWLPNASYARAAMCLDGCPGISRRWLQSLLRDLISGYPAVRFGVPVLLHYVPDRVHSGEILHAPIPLRSPTPGIVSSRWIEPNVLEISQHILDPVTHAKLRLLPDSITAGVLMLRSPSEETPAEPEGAWWKSVFETSSGGLLQVFAGHVWPLIDAVEASQVMQEVVITGERPECSVVFLSDDRYRWAVEAGGRFRKAVAQDISGDRARPED